MIHRSPLPDVEIPDVPLPGYVLHRAARARRQAGPDRRARPGASSPTAQLDQGVRALAGGLAARGLRARATSSP